MVKIKAAPFLADLNTNAITARTMAKNVVTTAANCGLLPKGAATKKDQLARVRPKRMWIITIRPVFASTKMRNRQRRPTMIQAGR